MVFVTEIFRVPCLPPSDISSSSSLLVLPPNGLNTSASFPTLLGPSSLESVQKLGEAAGGECTVLQRLSGAAGASGSGMSNDNNMGPDFGSSQTSRLSPAVQQLVIVIVLSCLQMNQMSLNVK